LKSTVRASRRNVAAAAVAAAEARGKKIPSRIRHVTEIPSELYPAYVPLISDTGLNPSCDIDDAGPGPVIGPAIQNNDGSEIR
jgi:hypothetical protein